LVLCKRYLFLLKLTIPHNEIIASIANALFYFLDSYTALKRFNELQCHCYNKGSAVA